MVERSPFPFHGPLAPGEVSGRADLRADLTRRIEQRRLTALLGPRRYGKTSLIRQVAADLGERDHLTVWVDLYELGSMADLAGAFDRGLAATRGPLRKVLDHVAGTFSLDLGLLGVQLTGRASERPEPVLKLRSMLQVLVEVAQRQQLLLVLDEFSGIAGVEHGAGVLRTELQHHYRELGIVFAGSQPSTMAALFTDRAQPFFSQADLLAIEPLSADEVVTIVHEGFERTERSAGGVVARLAAMAEGHPQRVMQLADALWWRVLKGHAATAADWEGALADVRRDVAGSFEQIFELLPPGQQKVLRVVAAGGSVYGAAADAISLPLGTARGAVKTLVGNAELVRVNDRLAIVDPLFADWIRRRFAV